jgi:hypothetical protein
LDTGDGGAVSTIKLLNDIAGGPAGTLMDGAGTEVHTLSILSGSFFVGQRCTKSDTWGLEEAKAKLSAFMLKATLGDQWNG